MYYEVPHYDFFLVTKKGKVKNKHTGNILTPYRDKDGYLRVTAKHKGDKQRCYVHRLVALAFIPNPENKSQVNHKNCIRDDNAVENLEWVTPKENVVHSSVAGNLLKGQEHSKTYLLDSEVNLICKMLEQGYSRKYIKGSLKLTYGTLDGIIGRRTWTHISSKYDIPLPKRRLSEECVHNICKSLHDGRTDKEIIKLYKSEGLTKGSLRFIKLRKTFKNISSLYTWE